jgi:hypothetical protein
LVRASLNRWRGRPKSTKVIGISCLRIGEDGYPSFENGEKVTHFKSVTIEKRPNLRLVI